MVCLKSIRKWCGGGELREVAGTYGYLKIGSSSSQQKQKEKKKKKKFDCPPVPRVILCSIQPLPLRDFSNRPGA